MKQYKMIDVVSEISQRENSPSTSGYERFVGLEHYVSGDVAITKYGSTARLDSAMKIFQSGDILVARRNVYLKRASVVFFDGLTSGDSIVLRAKNERMARLLPFVLNTDEFWNFAEQHSDGTMSKRLSPKTLMQYEFEMPNEDDQDAFADTLWAAADTKASYQRLLLRTDELVKAQFIEMFGDPITNSMNLPVNKLSAITTSRLGKMLDAKQQTGQYRFPYIANTNVQWFRFELQKLNQMDFNEADQVEFELQNGDLLVCEGGEVGRCAIWRNEVEKCFFQKAIHRVRCNTAVVLPEYLMWWFKMRSDYNSFSDIIGSKATIAHLPGIKLKALDIPTPDISKQASFVSFLNHIEKSKRDIEQTLDNLNNLIKSLIQQDFD